uniref:Ovule protein n=1 Tax=Heterorhabditis bacteriophora TaxID=37862 RepID=A0A1I7W9L9_HETBA
MVLPFKSSSNKVVIKRLYFCIVQSSEEWKSSTKLETLGSLQHELDNLLSTSDPEKLETLCLGLYFLIF